jgi:hypothetical protein
MQRVSVPAMEHAAVDAGELAELRLAKPYGFQ